MGPVCPVHGLAPVIEHYAFPFQDGIGPPRLAATH